VRGLKRQLRLLRLRERVEKQARLRLALALREDEERRLALAEAGTQLEEARRLWSVELAEGLDAARWSLLQSYLDQRQRGLARREGLVAEWRPRLETAQGELERAARERQALERWAGRTAARLRLEESRRERRALDEIGLRESLRRSAAEHGEE
jgi:flagellar export protein FliJ